MCNAIIFCIGSPTTLLPEAARAFLRHAYNQFYHDFANVDLKQIPFHYEVTYASALRSFRNAVYRYGMNFRKLFNTRKHSTLQGVAPEETRDKYPKLITIGIEGDCALKTLTLTLSKVKSDYFPRLNHAGNKLHAFQTAVFFSPVIRITLYLYSTTYVRLR